MSQSDDGVSVSEYCAEKLGSFGQIELKTLVEVGEESIAQILVEPSSSGGAADVLGVSHEVISSEHLERGELTRQELFP